MKWSIARRWLLDHSGFKIQNTTDDFIETYSIVGSGSPLPWVRIVKEPIDSGLYRITLEVGCDNIFGCVPDARLLLSDFAATVPSATLPMDLPLSSQPAAKTLPSGNPNSR